MGTPRRGLAKELPHDGRYGEVQPFAHGRDEVAHLGKQLRDNVRRWWWWGPKRTNGRFRGLLGEWRPH